MLRLTMGLCLVVLVGACDGDKAPAKAPAPSSGSAPAGPAADAGAAPAAPVEARADAGAAAPTEEKKAEGDSPGLLPSPDFTLKAPDLRLPESEGKKNLLGEDAKGGEEKKPRLLDVDLQKGE